MIPYLRNKSLVFTLSLIVSFILVAVVSILSFISYTNSKSMYFAQIDQQTKLLGEQMQAQYDTLEEAVKQLSANTTSGLPFDRLQKQLDAMKKADPSLLSTSVMAPQIEERNGKKFLKTIQADSDYAEALNVKPGSDYETPELYQDAIHQALKDGFARSVPINDAGIIFIASFYTIKDDQGKPAALLEIDNMYSEVKKDQLNILMSSIGIGLLIAVCGIGIIIPFILFSLRPLRQLADLSKQAAAGDLTVNVPLQSHNEIGLTAAAFNHMIGELRQLISSIQSTSNEVSRSAGNLQESAHQTAEASQEIAESIQEVSSGSELQFRRADVSHTSMNEVIVGLSSIAESSQRVSGLAAAAADQATAGDTVMAKTVNQMKAIESGLTSTVDNMHELKRMSGSIGEIMGLIREVAGQTNLLALNASIEAARAGEAGKGFAVVASEIRKLAERSSESSDQIDAILKGIITYTEQTAALMEHSVQEARTGTAVSQEAGQTFRLIVDSVREVSGQVQEVVAAAQNMSHSSEQVDDSLKELMRIANEASLNSARVAASSEEQAASMEEVSDLSEQLRGLAANLNHTIKKFNI